jgi:hypothetical protein
MDKIFADGLFFKKPSEKAPKFIIGNLSVNVGKFVPFLQAQTNERGWVNLDIKESKNGTIYIEVNDWQKGQETKKEEIPTINEMPY